MIIDLGLSGLAKSCLLCMDREEGQKNSNLYLLPRDVPIQSSSSCVPGRKSYSTRGTGRSIGRITSDFTVHVCSSLCQEADTCRNVCSPFPAASATYVLLACIKITLVWAPECAVLFLSSRLLWIADPKNGELIFLSPSSSSCFLLFTRWCED